MEKINRFANITIILMLLALASVGCISDGGNESHPEIKENIGYAPTEYEDRQLEIANTVTATIKERKYNSAKTRDIQINYNVGTDDGTYVALVYFDFDIMNRRETANGMMRMYSDDLSASLANNGITDISEIAVFWRDDYNSRNLKYHYQYSPTHQGFYLTQAVGE